MDSPSNHGTMTPHNTTTVDEENPSSPFASGDEVDKLDSSGCATRDQQERALEREYDYLRSGLLFLYATADGLSLEPENESNGESTSQTERDPVTIDDDKVDVEDAKRVRLHGERKRGTVNAKLPKKERDFFSEQLAEEETVHDDYSYLGIASSVDELSHEGRRWLFLTGVEPDVAIEQQRIADAYRPERGSLYKLLAKGNAVAEGVLRELLETKESTYDDLEDSDYISTNRRPTLSEAVMKLQDAGVVATYGRPSVIAFKTDDMCLVVEEVLATLEAA